MGERSRDFDDFQYKWGVTREQFLKDAAILAGSLLVAGTVPLGVNLASSPEQGPSTDSSDFTSGISQQDLDKALSTCRGKQIAVTVIGVKEIATKPKQVALSSTPDGFSGEASYYPLELTVAGNAKLVVVVPEEEWSRDNLLKGFIGQPSDASTIAGYLKNDAEQGKGYSSPRALTLMVNYALLPNTRKVSSIGLPTIVTGNFPGVGMMSGGVQQFAHDKPHQ